MATAAELIAQLNALEGDEALAVSTLFQNDQGAVIKSARGRVAAGAKREGAAKLPEVQGKLEQALEKIAELELEKQELSSKAPDFAAKEQQWKDKLATKERELRQQLEAKDAALTTTRRDVLTEKFVERLVAEGVNPKYARRVAAAEFADRFTFGTDGTPDVLKPGETSGYDAATVDEKVALLAADVRKTVDAEFIRTNVDTGGGRGAAGGGHTGYDPVKAGQQMAEQQKGQKESNLAFR